MRITVLFWAVSLSSAALRAEIKIKLPQVDSFCATEMRNATPAALKERVAYLDTLTAFLVEKHNLQHGDLLRQGLTLYDYSPADIRENTLGLDGLELVKPGRIAVDLESLRILGIEGANELEPVYQAMQSTPEAFRWSNRLVRAIALDAQLSPLEFDPQPAFAPATDVEAKTPVTPFIQVAIEKREAQSARRKGSFGFPTDDSQFLALAVSTQLSEAPQQDFDLEKWEGLGRNLLERDLWRSSGARTQTFFSGDRSAYRKRIIHLGDFLRVIPFSIYLHEPDLAESMLESWALQLDLYDEQKVVFRSLLKAMQALYHDRKEDYLVALRQLSQNQNLDDQSKNLLELIIVTSDENLSLQEFLRRSPEIGLDFDTYGYIAGVLVDSSHESWLNLDYSVVEGLEYYNALLLANAMASGGQASPLPESQVEKFFLDLENSLSGRFRQSLRQRHQNP